MEDVSAYELAMLNVAMMSKSTGVSKFEELIKAKQEAPPPTDGSSASGGSGSGWD
jgi:hypothetical protein